MSEQANQAWDRVGEVAGRSQGIRIANLFDAEPDRTSRFRAVAAGLYLDFSKARLPAEGLDVLLDFAAAAGVEQCRDDMFAGEPVNTTERRAANHMALRAATPPPEALQAAARAAELAAHLRAGRLPDGTVANIGTVVWIGIGGSSLGPRMVRDALAPLADGPEVRFAANVDGAELDGALAGLDPATVVVIVASKSFTTEETMLNAVSARTWLAAGVGAEGANARLVAVTAAPEVARAFGVSDGAILPMWDWVGGRFSLWSAVGLPVRIGLGNAVFESLLSGARSMDEHFQTAPLVENLPVILALLDLWNLNFLGLNTLAIVPYSARMQTFVPYVRQVIMESLGKSVDAAGQPLTRRAAPMVVGESGTDAQHSFFQSLHQGPADANVEFLLPVGAGGTRPAHQHMLTANCLAQSSAFMLGRGLAATVAAIAAEGAGPDDIARLAPHRVFPGNRPSTTLLFDDLTAATVGALAALYEHRVAVLGWLVGLNPFDQWGVEFGKTLARQIAPLLDNSDDPAPDPSTAALLSEIARIRGA